MEISGGSLTKGGIPIDDGITSTRLAGFRERDARSGSKSLLASASLWDENSWKSKSVNHGSIISRFGEEVSSPRPMVVEETSSGMSLECVGPGGSLVLRFDCRESKSGRKYSSSNDGA